MKTKKHGSNWTAYHDPETGRYFAEIIYTSREGREQYDFEITQEIYEQLGTFQDDYENEKLIKTAKRTYSIVSKYLDGALELKKEIRGCSFAG